MIDEYGNRSTVRQGDRMNQIWYDGIQRILQVRSERFDHGEEIQDQMDRTTYEDALDKTGTISTTSLMNSEADIDQVGLTVEAIETLGVKVMDDDLLRVHGQAPAKKEDGVTGLVYENANSVRNILVGNEKVQKATEIINELEADLVSYNEHRMNLQHKDNRNGFNQLF